MQIFCTTYSVTRESWDEDMPRPRACDGTCPPRQRRLSERGSGEASPLTENGTPGEA